MMSAKIDIVFAADKNELGACEVGKRDVFIVDDKYLNDRLEELPKILRDMIIAYIEVNPEKADCLCTVGYLIMGKLQSSRFHRAKTLCSYGRFANRCVYVATCCEYICLLET